MPSRQDPSFKSPPFGYLFFFSVCFLLFPILSGPSVHSAQVTVAWNANTETEVAGYKVYYGQASRSYQFFVDAGDTTSCTLSNLEQEKTYYIAAAAYDVAGDESDFSDELQYDSQSACGSSISPYGQSFSASGGSGTIQVMTQTGCGWTAISDASWLIVTSNQSATGNGIINYAVMENGDGSARTATFTVAGQTFFVSQEGPSPVSGSASAVLQLNFDEGQGTVAMDSSGNDNHGTVNSADYAARSPGNVYALTFDGIDDYVAVGPSPSLEPLRSTDISVSLWVRHAQETTEIYGGIMKGPYGDGYHGSFRIIDYHNKPLAQINFGDNEPIWILGNPLMKGRWAHIVLTYDHENIKLYQNGKLVQAVPETRNIHWDAHHPDITIGLAQWYFKGQLDNVSIYAYALTLSEVQQSYAKIL